MAELVFLLLEVGSSTLLAFAALDQALLLLVEAVVLVDELDLVAD